MYLRTKTYQNKIFRLSNKFVIELKWLHFSERFDIHKNSRELLLDYKNNYNLSKCALFEEVSLRMRAKMKLSGVTEEKVVSNVIDKFTKHLKSEEFVSRSDQILTSHLCNHEYPPVLHTNVFEIKHNLQIISAEFGIIGDIEIDSGYSFTYQIEIFFPNYFKKQVAKL